MSNLKFNELSTIERRRYEVRLGTEGAAIPAARFDWDENGNLSLQKGVIQSDRTPLVIYSTVPAPRVNAIYNRELPVPSDWHNAQRILHCASPESKKCMIVLLGPQGVGKSQTARFAGKLLSPDGMDIIDVGDSNIQDLFWEPVIDYGAGVREQINQRLNTGQLTGGSLEIMEHELAYALETDAATGRRRINWSKVGKKQGSGNDKAYGDSKLTEKAVKALQDIVTLEALEGANSKSFGFHMVKGRLIRNWETGRPTLIDEIDKIKDDSETGVYALMEMFGGVGPRRVTIRSRMKVNGQEEDHSYAFDMNERRIGFVLIATGNTSSDGSASSTFSKSFYSRLEKIEFQPRTVEDWTQAWSHHLTGLPLTAHFEVNQDLALRDPKAFTERLKAMRLAETDPHEDVARRNWHLENIARWPAVLEAARMAGDFLHYASDLVSPTSRLHTGQNANVYAKAYDEICTNSFAERHPIDFRIIEKLVDNALQVKPTILPMDASTGHDPALVSRPLDLPESQQQASNRQLFGSQLQYEFMQFVGDLTLGRPQLQGHLLTKARHLGIFPTVLHDARPGGVKTLTSLLDNDPHQAVGGSLQLFEIQAYLCKSLRRQHPDLLPSNDVLVPLDSLARSLQLEAAAPLTADPAQQSRNSFLHLPNSNIDEVSYLPFRAVETWDSYNLPPKYRMRILPEVLADRTDVIYALTLPGIGKNNIRALWTRAVSQAEEPRPSGEHEAVQVAENRSALKLAFNTLAVRGHDGGVEHLHILHDEITSRTLVIGDGAQRDLQRELRRAGIDYADRQDVYTDSAGNSKNRAEEAVESFMVAAAQKASGRTATLVDLKQVMADAIRLRNTSATVSEGFKARDPGSLLSSPDLTPELPHFILRKPLAPT